MNLVLLDKLKLEWILIINYSSKVNEKTLRLQYIRVLEKFSKRTIALLKHPKFDFEIFIKQTLVNYTFVEKFDDMRLDSEYLKRLKIYVQLILSTLSTHTKDFKEEQQLLLKEANLLHKEKNRTNYKKDKHQKKAFTDGY